MSDASLHRFADQLTGLMPRFVRAMLGQERNALARGVVSLPQFMILHLVAEMSPCAMSELVRRMELRAPTITSHVDHLVRAGLVRRESSARDRRLVMVRISPRGRTLLEQIRREKRRNAIRMFRRIPASRRRLLLSTMEDVIRPLVEKRGGAR